MQIFSIMKVLLFEGIDDRERSLHDKQSFILKIAAHLDLIFGLNVFPFNTLTTTVLTGKDYYSSMKHSYRTIILNPSKYLVTNIVSYYDIFNY